MIGKVLLDTYGHLRREHSIAQAQRVSFTPNDPVGAEIVRFPIGRQAGALQSLENGAV